MDSKMASFLLPRTWWCACAFVLILLTVSATAHDTLQDTDSIGTAPTDFSKLWEIYILPRLEMDIYNKMSQFRSEGLDSSLSNAENADTDITLPKNRLKRVGIAGLENMDLMTNTLDQQNKLRNTLRMSVNRPFSDLRRLMLQNGRRK